MFAGGNARAVKHGREVCLQQSYERVWELERIARRRSEAAKPTGDHQRERGPGRAAAPPPAPNALNSSHTVPHF